MASILNIGTNALLAFQRALVTTGNNVANVNTEGYSRQRLDLTTQIPQRLGSSYLGSGVKVENVRRQYDEFLAGQVRGSQSSTSELEAYYKYAAQIDNMVADPDTGLDPTLQDFFDALQGLSNDPSSIPSRQLLLSETASLVDRFHDFDTQLQDIQDRLDSEVENMVSEISRLGDGIAKLNASITSSPGLHEGHMPNDLLDQRDQLINELSEYVNVSTVHQDDGAINVYFGRGQALVLDQETFDLRVMDSTEVPGRKEIGYAGSGSGSLLVTSQISGGQLGGLLRVRDEILEPGRQQVGLVAMGLAFEVNAQHRQGINLNSLTGQDYFTDLTVSSAIARGSNAGTGVIQATITDPSELAASDYRLSYSTAAGYRLTRLSDNTLVYPDPAAALPAGLPAPGSLAVGFDLSLTAGAVADGDSFLIRPVLDSAAAIDLAISDPRKIAAAGMLRAEVPSTNQGTGTLSAPVVNGAVAPPNNILPLAQIRLTYNQATTSFDVSGPAPAGGTSFAYVPGATQTLYGFDVTLNGAPANGDVFIISGGVSDNRNALAMADLQQANTMLADTSGNPTASFQDTFADFVAFSGSRTRQADVAMEAQQGLLEINKDALQTVSGVNLDEEAADLVRFQQAYQAAAKVISTAQSIFDTLINAVG